MAIADEQIEQAAAIRRAKQLVKSEQTANATHHAARQKMVDMLSALRFPQDHLVIDYRFLDLCGVMHKVDIGVPYPKAIFRTSPLLVVNIYKSGQSFDPRWVTPFHKSGVKYLVWYNGSDLKVLILQDDETFHEYPAHLPTWHDIGRIDNPDALPSKASLRPGYDLKRILSQMHDHLYGNSNVRIPSRLGVEIQKLLLVKRFDEERANSECSFCVTRSELPNGFNGGRTIPVEHAARVARRVRDLAAEHDAIKAKEQHIGSLELDDRSIYYAAFCLEGISLKETPSDVLGDALEVFRSIAIKREGGQFFTKRNVVDLALTLVGYTGEPGQYLADISCGTGGFLRVARERIIQIAERNGITSTQEQNALVSEHLLGVEIDQDLTLIANTSPDLATLPQTMVERHDSLAPVRYWSDSLSSRLAPDTRSFMVGNPPFGTKITVKDAETLQEFDLAHTWRRKGVVWEKSSGGVVPRSPDVLFIERNVDLLQPGTGAMVLVVPYQILSGPKEGFVREWLMQHCKIIAIIDLPDDTFQPHTGTKGILLVVERRAATLPSWTEEPEYPIFMACPQRVGHDRRGAPVFKRDTPDEIDTDLPDVAAAFSEFRQGRDPSIVTPIAFSVSSSLIQRATDIRLNAAYYQPSASGLRHRLTLIARDDPTLALAPLGQLVQRIFYPGRFKRDYTDNPSNSTLFLGGSNITELIPMTRKRVACDSEHYADLALESGWILVTRSGTTGIVATVPADWAGYAASEHIIRIVPDPNKLHPGYLYGYLRSTIGQQLLRGGVFGSVVPEIDCSYIASIPILYPRNPDRIREVGENIQQADALRAEASRLIQETSGAIESLVF